MDIIQGAREVGIADLNGDGKPEIVVTNSSTNNIYIFKNESSGGTLNINPNPIKVAVTGATETLALELKDMDGDRSIDIVVSKNQNQDLFILKNTSSSSTFSFTDITKITLPGQFNDITTADFNQDGKLDIIATSLFSAQAMVLMNKSTNAGFSFDPPITLTTDTQPFGIDVSDLNGDGFPDIIIPSRGTNTLNVYLHNKNISPVGFTKVTVPTTKNNWFVRAGDLDGDAKPDIAFTAYAGPTGPYSVDVIRNKNCHVPKIQNIPPLFICPSQTIRLATIPVQGVMFDWNNGFGSIKDSPEPFVIISAAANYTVTATGEGGVCKITSAPITIQSGAGALPADPVITSNSPICAGNTLTLSTPTVAGAGYAWTGPNNFTSSSSSFSISDATVANAGIYSLTIKVGDCSSSIITKRVEVATFGSFSISSSSATNSMCQGQSLTLTVNSQTGYTYQWMKDNTNISGQTGSTLTVNTSGTYKVKVSNTALGCSQETSSIDVDAFAMPVANFSVNPTGCVGNVISFINSSITDPQVPSTSIVHTWDLGDNTTSVLEDPTHTYNVAQTYTPKLTVSYTGITGCTNTVSKSINIITGTNPTITSTKSELCDNESETATLKVTETLSTYLWTTTSETSQSIDITAPGDYTVETTDANGCKGTSTITIEPKTEGCLPGTNNTDFPYVFTPNGDSQNDFWIIPDAENKQDCTMNIFDGRGRRILQKKGFPIDGWNGRSDSDNEVPEGTYYYVFSCPNDPPITGTVLIVR
jgi:gliding motility-associated-like protein